MRVVIALPLLALAACQVTKDDANDSVSVEYNQDVAENGVAAATNEAGNIAEDIVNDVQQSADKVGNKVDEVQADSKDTNRAN
ncbi:hypothetical protein LVY65_03665 [Sphingomonas sp. G124]|uniref:Uncharacterized protein n=1 Tax=Sphingomonas cremea TaxID=2904799 RepID=A0A9X1QL65_9SPHN|nr:hypothetical protein [Sphingomonas cremea]MCF2514167.1 hypothetical protein [Sphingomonas cremea]